MLIFQQFWKNILEKWKFGTFFKKKRNHQKLILPFFSLIALREQLRQKVYVPKVQPDTPLTAEEVSFYDF